MNAAKPIEPHVFTPIMHRSKLMRICSVCKLPQRLCEMTYRPRTLA